MMTKTNNSTFKNRTNKGMTPFRKRVNLNIYKKIKKKYKKRRMTNRLMSWKKLNSNSERILNRKRCLVKSSELLN